MSRELAEHESEKWWREDHTRKLGITAKALQRRLQLLRKPAPLRRGLIYTGAEGRAGSTQLSFQLDKTKASRGLVLLKRNFRQKLLMWFKGIRFAPRQPARF